MAAHGSSRSRTWWIVPYFGGLLAVVVVAAAVIAIRPALRSSAHSAATHPPANGTATGAPLPAEMFPGALFGKLTADLAARSEAGFLAMAAPGARAAMKTWWDNQAALGFITGAVIPTASHDTVRIDGQGNGSTTVLAGVHNPLDPVIGGKPDVCVSSCATVMLAPLRNSGTYFARRSSSEILPSCASINSAAAVNWCVNPVA